MVGPLFNQTRIQSAPPASGRRVNVMAILLIVAVEVLLAGMLLWLWIAMGSRLLRRCTQKCCMHGKVWQSRQGPCGTVLKHIHCVHSTMELIALTSQYAYTLDVYTLQNELVTF